MQSSFLASTRQKYLHYLIVILAVHITVWSTAWLIFWIVLETSRIQTFMIIFMCFGTALIFALLFMPLQDEEFSFFDMYSEEENMFKFMSQIYILLLGCSLFWLWGITVADHEAAYSGIPIGVILGFIIFLIFENFFRLENKSIYYYRRFKYQRASSRGENDSRQSKNHRNLNSRFLKLFKRAILLLSASLIAFGLILKPGLRYLFGGILNPDNIEYILGIISFSLIWLSITEAFEVCMEHFALRFALYFTNAVPWNYTRFLNHCTDRRLLQRVGGHYRFIHRLVQEHFAAMPLEQGRGVDG
jgi:hypothetical protein